MKKPRKKAKPELRVRISEEVFRALKFAVARDRAQSVNGVTASEITEAALAVYPMIKREMENA